MKELLFILLFSTTCFASFDRSTKSFLQALDDMPFMDIYAHARFAFDGKKEIAESFSYFYEYLSALEEGKRCFFQTGGGFSNHDPWETDGYLFGIAIDDGNYLKTIILRCQKDGKIYCKRSSCKNKEEAEKKFQKAFANLLAPMDSDYERIDGRWTK